VAILRIKEVMTAKGKSREQLANAVGVSKTTISNICSEKETSLPTIKLLVKIANALDVDIRELFVPTKEIQITEAEVLKAKEHISSALAILNGNPEDK
jgi:transcriptional regulator with XRE-family HTH domain